MKSSKHYNFSNIFPFMQIWFEHFYYERMQVAVYSLGFYFLTIYERIFFTMMEHQMQNILSFGTD